VRILGAGHFYLGDGPQLFAILGPSSTRGARMIRLRPTLLEISKAGTTDFRAC
jgi:hypothetical protein